MCINRAASVQCKPKFKMNSTYFKWEWVKDGKVLNENDQRFDTRNKCFTDALRTRLNDDNLNDDKLDDTRIRVTCYEASTDRQVPEKKVYGSFDLGHGIRIQAVEYDGKPRIDIRIWEKTPKGKGKCFKIQYNIIIVIHFCI